MKSFGKIGLGAIAIVLILAVLGIYVAAQVVNLGVTVLGEPFCGEMWHTPGGTLVPGTTVNFYIPVAPSGGGSITSVKGTFQTVTGRIGSIPARLSGADTLWDEQGDGGAGNPTLTFTATGSIWSVPVVVNQKMLDGNAQMYVVATDAAGRKCRKTYGGFVDVISGTPVAGNVVAVGTSASFTMDGGLLNPAPIVNSINALTAYTDQTFKLVDDGDYMATVTQNAGNELSMTGAITSTNNKFTGAGTGTTFPGNTGEDDKMRLIAMCDENANCASAIDVCTGGPAGTYNDPSAGCITAYKTNGQAATNSACGSGNDKACFKTMTGVAANYHGCWKRGENVNKYGVMAAATTPDAYQIGFQTDIPAVPADSYSATLTLAATANSGCDNANKLNIAQAMQADDRFGMMSKHAYVDGTNEVKYLTAVVGTSESVLLTNTFGSGTSPNSITFVNSAAAGPAWYAPGETGLIAAGPMVPGAVTTFNTLGAGVAAGQFTCTQVNKDGVKYDYIAICYVAADGNACAVNWAANTCKTQRGTKVDTWTLGTGSVTGVDASYASGAFIDIANGAGATRYLLVTDPTGADILSYGVTPITASTTPFAIKPPTFPYSYNVCVKDAAPFSSFVCGAGGNTPVATFGTTAPLMSP